MATDAEREGILNSFVEEAKALAGIYHPNVANIIDRGVSGNVPTSGGMKSVRWVSIPGGPVSFERQPYLRLSLNKA